jgi:hypothetical protein
MPSAIWVPEVAIARSGREIDFPVLGYILYDLRHFNRVNYGWYTEVLYWVNSYRDGGAMPGDRKFVSPYTGERVLFTQLLDDFIDMWHYACNWDDLTDEEEENSGEMLTGVEDIDLFRAWPVDIGRFRLFPGLF